MSNPTDSDADSGRSGVALVTGGAKNLGLEVCRHLAAAGFEVLLTARDLERATAAAQGVHGARALQLDVTDPASIARLAQEVDRLDVLVHNAAGINDWSETVTSADLPTVRMMLETNVVGPWSLTQALLPVLAQSARPRLVWVTSGAGSHGDPQFGLTANGGAAASYGVSKAAANAVVRKLATELAAKGSPVKVNAVDPGLTATAPGMEAMGARPIPEGAKSIVWAALIDDDGPSGGFFRDGQPLSW